MLEKCIFNQKTKDRKFSVGDQVLVKFPQVWKFYKKWKGVFRVVKVLGRLNLVVQHNQGRKQLVVHVDRVRHLTLAENESFFDSKIEHEAKCELTTKKKTKRIRIFPIMCSQELLLGQYTMTIMLSK